MKHIIILLTCLTLTSIVNAQDLTKENKVAQKHLEKNIATTKLDVVDRSGAVLYTNQVSTLKFNGVSAYYSELSATIEPYCIGTLYPLKNVAQVSSEGSNSFVYFPQLQAYFGDDNKLHAMQKLIIPAGSNLITVYDFTSENGKALIMEFFSKSTNTFSYGFILETELKKLMDRVKKKEIGLISDARDNRTYKWVKIGDQKWFGENLQYLTDEHRSMDLTVSYSNYFGRYYNYSQATTSCPNGWHIPTDGEWKQMEKSIGIDEAQLDEMGMVSRVGSNATPGADLVSSDELMFYAKLSGVVSNKTGIYKLSAHRENGQYWTSSKADEVNGIMRVLGKQFDGIVRDKTGTQNFLSCRCIEDQDMTAIIQTSSKLKEISDKIKSNPSEAGNYFDRSIEFFLLGEARFALEDIDKAIELDGSDLEQKLFKAQIMFINSFEQDAAEIRNLVDEYTNVNKENDFAYYFQSRLALYDAHNGGLKVSSDSKRREEALQLINSALSIDANNPHYNSYKAKLLVVTGDYTGAVRALEKELKEDPKNGESHYLLGQMKLKHYNDINSGTNADTWCTQITGRCYKLTPKQIKDACSNFTKAINYGADVSPDFITICSELKQAETLEKHKPIIYTGPRGGRYTINSSGNKCYIPRR